MSCDGCKGPPWIGAKLAEFEKFEDRMTESGTGMLDRLWSKIDDLQLLIVGKASRGFLITVCCVLLTLTGTLFGLVYNSNQAILSEFTQIKVDIAVLVEKVK